MKKLTILVVDVCNVSRDRVVAALDGLGAVVEEADNGATALDRIRQSRPDLLVTDLLMPRLDGLGLLQSLRDEMWQVPAIVVSADIQVSSRRKATELGAVAFINKPFDPDRLRLLVLEALGTVEEIDACR